MSINSPKLSGAMDIAIAFMVKSLLLMSTSKFPGSTMGREPGVG